MIINRNNGWYLVSLGFSKELKDARKQMGITQRELADRTGISPSSICRMEMGRTREVSDKTIEKLECFYGIKFTREDNSNSIGDEYMKRIKELEMENATLKKLLMRYWDEEVTNG